MPGSPYPYKNAIFTPPLSYTLPHPVTAYVLNSCGLSQHTFYITGSSPSAVTAYPNPASGILNIEIDGQAFAQSRAAVQPVADTGHVLEQITFDVRLYNRQGDLLRQSNTQGGTVQWSVSGLPSGIYYLHVYDGQNDIPEMRQIVVGK
jgi:hypothetical protein